MPAGFASLLPVATNGREIPMCCRTTGNTFTAIFERDGDWYVVYCPEVPGANGQGRSKQETRTSLADAIELIFRDRREGSFRDFPDDAERDTVAVG